MSTITTILGADTITSSRTVINTNFSNLNTDKIETSTLDTDTALAANSDLKVATQKAVKAYVDALGGLATKTSGVGVGPASSTTQVVTHSLGRIPSVIRVSGYGNLLGSGSTQSGGSSNGVRSSSGNTCVYLPAAVTAGNATASSSTVFSIYLSGLTGINTEVHASGVIQNIGATTFDIVWTAVGDCSTATVFMWETN